MPGVGLLLLNMDKEQFQRHLKKATDFVIPFSQEFLIDNLPSSYLYLLFPNQSYDGNPLVGDEVTFPQERLPTREYIGPLNDDGVIDYLWRDGKVPEWVNITVYSYDLKYTYLELLCCGRFTAMKQLLYHRHEGYPPFHALGPCLPPNWESVEQHGKFQLFWHGRVPKINP